VRKKVISNRNAWMTLGLIAVLFFHLQPGTTQPHKQRVSLTRLERVLVFVIQKEVAASHIEQRNDTCLGLILGLR
jgi:hypothetical protein